MDDYTIRYTIIQNGKKSTKATLSVSSMLIDDILPIMIMHREVSDYKAYSTNEKNMNMNSNKLQIMTWKE